MSIISLFLFYNYFRSKTEGADKFWASLDPYFADISDSDLHNLLEDVTTFIEIITF